MSSKYWTPALWLLAFALFLGLLWCLNLTAFNYWASGGPPTPHPEIYRMRGNIFFGVACGFLLAFVLSVRSLIKRKRRPTGR
jgi:hypothetical protein